MAAKTSEERRLDRVIKRLQEQVDAVTTTDPCGYPGGEHYGAGEDTCGPPKPKKRGKRR